MSSRSIAIPTLHRLPLAPLFYVATPPQGARGSNLFGLEISLPSAVPDVKNFSENGDSPAALCLMRDTSRRCVTLPRGSPPRRRMLHPAGCGDYRARGTRAEKLPVSRSPGNHRLAATARGRVDQPSVLRPARLGRAQCLDTTGDGPAGSFKPGCWVLLSPGPSERHGPPNDSASIGLAGRPPESRHGVWLRKHSAGRCTGGARWRACSTG